MNAITLQLIFPLLTLIASNPGVTGRARELPQEAPPYAEIFYTNGGLRLQGYLYKPLGKGPFPLIIYNHGSRAGAERAERPFPFVGSLLTNAGYAVFVPERRGYGKSDGTTFREEVGTDVGQRFIGRLQEETGDVLAALDYLKTISSVDNSRIGVMGWSLGGLVSVFAASRSNRFFAVVNQAGGSLTWSHSPVLQSELPAAVRKIRSPLLCMVAENDATTLAVKSVYDAAQAAGIPAALKVYPPFTPTQPTENIAPGHLIFSVQGVTKWGNDVVSFFNQHCPR